MPKCRLEPSRAVPFLLGWSTGGFVFPKEEIDAIKRQDGRDLTRFDIDFDLPERFLAPFPPAMYLVQRPELGDVSQGKLISLTNFFEMFNGILTPRQGGKGAAGGGTLSAIGLGRGCRASSSARAAPTSSRPAA
jgi:hypothetical protein